MFSLKTAMVGLSLLALSIVVTTNAWAMSASQVDKGFAQCVKWCNDHNKTAASQVKCGDQCFHYWYIVVKTTPSMTQREN